VLLSFSFFAGLLTLLLLAQRTIPERSTESMEPLPTEVVGPSILQPTAQPTEAPSSQAGGTATEPSVLTVPGGPVFVAPVGGLGPSGQVNESATTPETGKKPGEGKGKGEPPPAETEEPSSPGGGPGPSPPGGGAPSGQPTPPPGVLPSEPEEEDDDDSSDEDEVEDDEDDETDTDEDGGEQANDGKGGQKSGKGGSEDED
jgi:hypothetical protein